MKTSGKHNEDDFILSLRTSPERKALATIVAEVENTTVTDLILDLIEDRATALGILNGGKVVEDYRDRVIVLAEITRSRRRK